jgi:hypothetical protein
MLGASLKVRAKCMYLYKQLAFAIKLINYSQLRDSPGDRDKSTANIVGCTSYVGRGFSGSTSPSGTLDEKLNPTPPFREDPDEDVLSVGADLEACTDDKDLRDGTHDCEGDMGGFGTDDNSDEDEDNKEIRPDENEDERVCLADERVLR